MYTVDDINRQATELAKHNFSIALEIGKWGNFSKMPRYSRLQVLRLLQVTERPKEIITYKDKKTGTELTKAQALCILNNSYVGKELIHHMNGLNIDNLPDYIQQTAFEKVGIERTKDVILTYFK